jgi:hypothetical protein
MAADIPVAPEQPGVSTVIDRERETVTTLFADIGVPPSRPTVWR